MPVYTKHQKQCVMVQVIAIYLVFHKYIILDNILHVQPTSKNIYNLEATKYKTNRRRCGFLYQSCLYFGTIKITQFSPLLQTLHACSAKLSSGSCKPSDCVDSDDSFSNKFKTINGKTHDVENNHQMTVAV